SDRVWSVRLKRADGKPKSPVATGEKERPPASEVVSAEMAEEGCSQQGGQPLRVLEFYSGIGGMRYSLLEAEVNAIVVEAFEINDLANDVYQHNFGHRPYQGNIQNLSAADLDNYGADVWLLSPPCQPYTRQGLQKDSSDARAFSFLNILELIPQLSQAPRMLFVENVVGFETSDTHNKMIETLAKTGFVTQEFILSPLQFTIPYSRPRYFCLAKRKPSFFQNSDCNNQLLYTPGPLFGNDNDRIISTSSQSPEGLEKMIQSCEPIQRFLEYDISKDDNQMESGLPESPNAPADVVKSVDQSFQLSKSAGFSLDKPDREVGTFNGYPFTIDIVYTDSKRCCCFTKSYYRYVKGTGSLLATIQPKVKGKTSPLKDQGLRYFTPREVANLHSFPKEFSFPEFVSLKQRYALLGNSLSIAVVAPLIKLI
ncbi:hypothetical protein V2J09_007967, partial [Rumex salicifolius]